MSHLSFKTSHGIRKNKNYTLYFLTCLLGVWIGVGNCDGYGPHPPPHPLHLPNHFHPPEFHHPRDEIVYDDYASGVDLRGDRGMNFDPDSTRCGGICLPSAQCLSAGGTPSSSQTCASSHPASLSHPNWPRVCCNFAKSCDESSGEGSGYFQSPGYPAPTLSTLICQYDIHIQPGVCALRLEFLEFNTTTPLDRGLCNIDQFLILNGLEGATFPRCGDLTGYTTIVGVDPRHRLPLTLLSIIQSSKEEFKWNIKFTQIKCDAVKLVKDDSNCNARMINTTESSKGSASREEDAENVIRESSSVITESDDSMNMVDQIFYNRNGIDNAFYVAYLKKAHEALVLATMEKNSTRSANETLCSNFNSGGEKNKSESAVLKKRSPRSLEEEEESNELGRIIRGKEAILNEFPWQVSVQDGSGHFCGGAIISPQVILTAAHCFLSIDPLRLSTLKVVVGDLNLNETSEGEETAHVQTIVFHSHFDPYYLENDIAVIKLNSSLTFRKGVQPVCLPQHGNSYSGLGGVISGWGATSYPQGKLATLLQQTHVTIIENSECKSKLAIDYVYSTMICAVAPNCSGTCFGDSGGPLVVYKGDKPVLVGLVSFGIGGCALFPYWPDVYTRVEKYLNWINYALH